MSDSSPSIDIDFKALLMAAPDAVVVHDLNNCVLFWNRAAETLYGWSAEEIQGQPISRIFYLVRKEREEDIEVLLANGIWQGELRQLDRNGDEYLVHVRQQIQRDAYGQPEAIISFNTDITEMRRLADVQERARYVKSSSILAGGVTHELNNALAPIMLSSAMLKRSIEGEKAQSMVGMIEKCATKGAKLVADLLAFERGRGGGDDIIRAIQIRRNIHRIGEELVPANVDLQLNIAEELWECKGKLSELDEAFQYVIENACEAMPDGGKLQVDVGNRYFDQTFERLAPGCKAGAYVSFVFTDTGCGIAAEALSRVAEPFFTTKAPAQGFGFGLSNTQATIKGHHGFMVVESQPGEGTSLSIFLPTDDAVAVQFAESERCRVVKSGQGQRILVADDEIFVRATIKQALEACGYEVILALDGVQALGIYESRRDQIDLVMTNLQMPNMDGCDLCHALKEINPEVKILVSSGHQQVERLEGIKSCGVRHFISKPYTACQLSAAVDSVLAG